MSSCVPLAVVSRKKLLLFFFFFLCRAEVMLVARD
jgi:hypothetical protein